ICETIRENQECVLIFTQYKEIIPYLVDYLGDVFEARGLSIDGSTPVSKRAEIVDAFNNQTSYIPFIVLSLKAGGTGLNLTKASHVIHFDRWWNPAVENQATDRAYRIGQKQNVLVHKLVCTGTIEEHIDELIESKKELAEQVIGSGADKWITEMSNEELLDLVRLD
ncbi:MAG: SWF/SNF helicase family protein, partial [Ileibacterium sp.]|nr:SWF/SNF helicase family protein [Ileibacterium sp.]